MHPKPELQAPWAEFLSAVDHSLTSAVELHCVGGFVLTVLYGIPRATGDLDYISLVPKDAYEEVERIAGWESNLAKKYKVYFQQAGGVIDLPENYEERLVELDLGFQKLHLKVLEPYDLALSKLTRNSPKDREDVKHLASRLRLSFSQLYERFSREMKPWLPNLDRHELTLRIWKEYFSE